MNLLKFTRFIPTFVSRARASQSSLPPTPGSVQNFISYLMLSSKSTALGCTTHRQYENCRTNWWNETRWLISTSQKYNTIRSFESNENKFGCTTIRSWSRRYRK